MKEETIEKLTPIERDIFLKELTSKFNFNLRFETEKLKNGYYMTQVFENSNTDIEKIVFEYKTFNPPTKKDFKFLCKEYLNSKKEIKKGTTIKQFSGIFSTLAIVGATICYCMGHTDNAILFLIWSLILRD